jgi:hypothetical protein
MTNESTDQLDRMLRSHTERCLQDIWQQPDLTVDDDGDYPYRHGTAACWVRVGTAPNPDVQVFAHAAFGVKRTAKVLAELNDLNARSRWVRLHLADGTVIASGRLHWTGVNRDALRRLMVAAGQVADDVGLMIATVHGGQVPFQPADDELAEPGEAA